LRTANKSMRRDKPKPHGSAHAKKHDILCLRRPVPTGAPPDKSNDAKPMRHHRQRPGSSRQQAQIEPIDGMPKTLFTLSKIQTTDPSKIQTHGRSDRLRTSAAGTNRR
jgi:hypothetical protein